MSAAELIEQIKALPPEEIEQVRQFLLNGNSSSAGASGPVKYLDREEAAKLGRKVMEENEDLLRRLAQ